MENNTTANQAFQEYVNLVIETKNPSFDLSDKPFASQIDVLEIPKVWSSMPWLETVNLSNVDLKRLFHTTRPHTLQPLDDFRFNTLGGITSLILDNCNLSGISIGSNYLKLKTLSLRNNSTLSGLFIGETINLNLLDLSVDIAFITNAPIQLLNPDSSGSKISLNLSSLINSIITLKLSNNPRFEFHPNGVSFNLENSLETLYADGTGLTNKSDLIYTKFSKLKNFYLQNNAIEDLGWIHKYSNLEILNLSNNKIQDLTPLTKLKELQILYLDKNKIEDMSPLSELPDLQKLLVSDNPVKKLGRLSILADLSVLGLNNCALTTDELTNIGSLSQLTELRLRNANIEKIGFLSGLKNLITLDLKDNKIQEIESLKDINDLKELNLENNPLEDYPEERRLDMLNGADLKAYFNKKREEVNNHVKLILFGNSTVGKSNLNNVLIHNRLLDTQNTTDGVKISQWTVKDSPNKNLRVNIWDFGGQEYYHGTHRLFLTKNSVFALLWNEKYNRFGRLSTVTPVNNVNVERETDHFHYDYWLDNIAFYSRNAVYTEGSSLDNIFLVQNLFGTDQKTKTLPSDMDSKGIKEALAFNLLNAPSAKPDDTKSHKWFDVFKTELIATLEQNAGAEKMTVDEAEIQKCFVELFEASINPETKLSSSKKNKNPFAFAKDEHYIKWEDFLLVCQQKWSSLSKKELHNILIALRNKGIVTYLIYFEEGEKKRVIIFDQKWLLDGINSILNPNIREKNGEFALQNVEDAVGTDLAFVFIELMERYNIAVKLQDANDTYLAPQYLPNDNSLNVFFEFAINNSNSESLTIRLPVFYYRNAMLRLIWLYGAALTQKQRSMLWKNGIFFTYPKTTTNVFVHGATVKDENGLETNEWDITIAIATNDSKIKEDLEINLLEDIFGTFNPDYRSYARPQMTEKSASRLIYTHKETGEPETFMHIKEPKFKISQRIKLSVKKSAFISVENMIKQKESEMSFAMDANNKRVPMKLFESCLKTLGLKTPTPSVFISYKHDGEEIAMLDDLLSHLEALKRSVKFDYWTDKEIKVGENWNDDIQDKLRNAEVFVMLISAKYLASNYIYKHEWSVVKENADRKNIKIVPVLLSSCTVPTDIDALQFAAIEEGRRKPIEQWTYPDQAWVKIANTIKEYLAL
jgi:internalin A